MGGQGPVPLHPSRRQRRNATFAMTRLPAEGRKGRAPVWPLIPDVVMAARRDLAEAAQHRLQEELEELKADGKRTEPIERKLAAAQEKAAILNAQLAHQLELEAQLWRQLWKLPQAVQWERLGWLRDVAQYVRHKVMAELGDLASAKEARQWSDRLGLSPQAMLRLRWEVAVDETAVKRQEREARRPAGSAGPVAVPAAAAVDAFAALRAV